MQKLGKLRLLEHSSLDDNFDPETITRTSDGQKTLANLKNFDMLKTI